MTLPLRWKVTLGALLAVACSLAVAGLMTVQALERHHLVQLRENLEAKAKLAEQSLHPLFQYPEQSPPLSRLRSMVRDIGLRASARITVIAADGTVIADSAVLDEDLPDLENHRTRPEVREALSTGHGHDVRLSHTTGERTMYQAHVMTRAEPAAPVIIRVGFPMALVDRDIDHVTHNILLALSIAFLTALSLTIWLARSVTQPISDIIQAAQRLASGAQTVPIKTSAQDEVGLLATTLNQLADQLHAKIGELSEDRAQLLAVLTSMVEGVMVLDRRGYVLQVNPALERMFGISRSEARGRPFSELFRHRRLNELVEAMLRSQKNQDVEIVLPLTSRCLHIEASVAGGERDNEACIVLVCHDITELRHLETIRKDFVANVSHELRTPLTSIKGYVEALLDGAKDDPVMAIRFLDIILKQSDRLNLIIEDLLELSRIESGRLSFRVEPIDVLAVIDRALSTIKPLAEKKGHRLVISADTTVPAAAGDEDRLVQVLTNLVDNAIKYTPAGGTITIATGKASPTGPTGQAVDAIDLSVSDTGIGIPEPDRPRIFERFYRVDKARSRELGGTGLGLAIVKHIVEGHGGQVWVEANEPKGSRFVVRLPVLPQTLTVQSGE